MAASAFGLPGSPAGGGLSRLGVRTPADDSRCPCGGGAFGSCCGPILAGLAAETAERLMRSRYTAFTVGDLDHLRETWHPSTRPDRIDLEAGLRWESLAIEETIDGGVGDRRGWVRFRARWSDAATGERGELRELSRFVRQRERWWYVEGDVGSPA